MAVDGIEPHVIRDAMEAELEYSNEYGKVNAKVFRSAGGYAPTIGILGAVLGLIHVMENLSDPSKLGAGIAVAFVATVYGVGSANLLFLPFATKLEVRQRHEMITNEMILEGVVALSTGENPRLIEEKLVSFFPNCRKAVNRRVSSQRAPREPLNPPPPPGRKTCREERDVPKTSMKARSAGWSPTRISSPCSSPSS